MKHLAIKFREAQFFAHAAHNLVSGRSFFSDHAVLGDLYSAYEDAYDQIIETMIGEKDQVLPLEWTVAGAEFAAANTIDGMNSNEMFDVIATLESDIRSDISILMQDQHSDGKQDLLQGLAHDSLKRTYKINQRIA